MRQAGWLTVVGVGAGLVCSVGASMLMRKLLFGVEAWDLPTLGLVALVLGERRWRRVFCRRAERLP